MCIPLALIRICGYPWNWWGYLHTPGSDQGMWVPLELVRVRVPAYPWNWSGSGYLHTPGTGHDLKRDSSKTRWLQALKVLKHYRIFTRVKNLLNIRLSLGIPIMQKSAIILFMFFRLLRLSKYDFAGLGLSAFLGSVTRILMIVW